MLLVLLVCAAPVIASYFTYFVIRPQARTNYGELILPTRSLPAPAAARRWTGAASTPRSLQGQWLLRGGGPGATATRACEKRLYMQRQLREMLGRERDRVDKLWLVTDDGRRARGAARGAAGGPGPARAARAARGAGRLAAAGRRPGARGPPVPRRSDGRVDDARAGRCPTRPSVKRDLERLLRASASWDQPGR